MCYQKEIYPKETTLAILQDGSHFYGTTSPLEHNADVDLIIVDLARTRDIFIKEDVKTTQEKYHIWGKEFDIKTFELDHYLNQFVKGNVQFIEKILYADESFVYQNLIWWQLWPQLEYFAKLCINASKFGHVLGWAKNTLNLIDKNGFDVKRGLVLFRILTSTVAFAEHNTLVPIYPQNIPYCRKEYRKDMKTLYQVRMGEQKSLMKHSMNRIEETLSSYLDVVKDIVDQQLPKNEKNKEVMPVKKTDIILEARKLALKRDGFV